MPTGPEGQKRPADPVANALAVAKIATREQDEEYANQGMREGGLKGGWARAKKLTAEQRSKIAKKAASKRWGKG